MKSSLKKISLFVCFIFASFTFTALLAQSQGAFAANSKVQEKDLSSSGNSDANSATTDASAQSAPQKGGVFKVGRAFKTAGHSTKNGFLKVGSAFKWLGGKIKRTFTGESDEKQTAQNTVTQSPKGSNLDRVGEDPQNTATDTRN